MAQIGLKNVHTASRTVSTTESTTTVTFGTPAYLAPAISANMDIEYAEGSLPADDITLYDIKNFKKGTLSLNTADLPATFITSYLGARKTTNGIIVNSAEDLSVECAVGFESLKADGHKRLVWFPRVKFAIPSEAYTTKGDSITFNTPTLEGTIMEEVIADAAGKHQWRYYIDDDATETGASTVISSWFTAVPTITFS